MISLLLAFEIVDRFTALLLRHAPYGPTVFFANVVWPAVSATVVPDEHNVEHDLPRGIGVATIRHLPAEWSQQHAALELAVQT